MFVKGMGNALALAYFVLSFIKACQKQNEELAAFLTDLSEKLKTAVGDALAEARRIRKCWMKSLTVRYQEGFRKYS